MAVFTGNIRTRLDKDTRIVWKYQTNLCLPVQSALADSLRGRIAELEARECWMEAVRFLSPLGTAGCRKNMPKC